MGFYGEVIQWQFSGLGLDQLNNCMAQRVWSDLIGLYYSSYFTISCILLVYWMHRPQSYVLETSSCTYPLEDSLLEPHADGCGFASHSGAQEWVGGARHSERLPASVVGRRCGALTSLESLMSSALWPGWCTCGPSWWTSRNRRSARCWDAADLSASPPPRWTSASRPSSASASGASPA